MNRVAPAFAAFALAIAVSLSPDGAMASIFQAHKSPAADPAAVQSAADIQRAIDEERYLDAHTMIEEALVSGTKDPMILILAGELGLAQKDYAGAFSRFSAIEKVPTVQARALQGEGIALAGQGRSKEAIEKLRAAVAADPAAWRAWNALGQEFDDTQDWQAADGAYQHALAASNDPAIVLNNRGFSRLLQRRLEEAVDDFVAALEKRPGLEIARTNLRLAMAMRGEYDRATAGGVAEDRAAVLNNAGFAAILRGDYDRAEELLREAIKAKGEYYGRASANLELAEALKAHAAPPTKIAADAH
jgi:Flp pilus assembly protein TadD